MFSFQSMLPVFAIAIPVHVSARRRRRWGHTEWKRRRSSERDGTKIQHPWATPLLHSQSIFAVVVFHAAGGEQEHQLVVEGEECEGGSDIKFDVFALGSENWSVSKDSVELLLCY